MFTEMKREIGKTSIIRNFNIALSDKTSKHIGKSVNMKICVSQFNQINLIYIKNCRIYNFSSWYGILY